MKSRMLFKAALACTLILCVNCSEVRGQQTTWEAAERNIEVDTADYPKHVEVLGLHVYGTAAASDDEMLHAANVLAEYLDNDEDGIADNQKILDAMIRANATLVVSKDSQDKRAHHRPWPNSQGVYTDEIFPLGQDDRYDGSLEEVLHLITDYGWERAYPSVFGRWRGTAVGSASEAARGGYFEKSPEEYPEDAWHTYYSETCDYGCNIAEYLHWALTSILGGHERYWKELGGPDQWDLRSREKVQAGDPAIYALLTNPQYKLPTVLPDGNYRGNELRIQYVNVEEVTLSMGGSDGNTGRLSVTNLYSPDLKALSDPASAGGLSVTNSLLPANIFTYLSCEAVLYGEPTTISTPLFEVKVSSDQNAPGPHWTVKDDTFSYTWNYDEGIKVDFAGTVADNGFRLRYTLTNTGQETLKRVLLHNCIPTTDAPAFFPGETKSLSEGNGRVGRYMGVYHRTYIWSKGRSFNFAETEIGLGDIHLAFMREGQPPIEWEWWTNGPETFDFPFIAVESKDGRFTTAVGFEAAEWACINAGDRNACYHLFPFFGDIEPGESSTVRGIFYLMPGTPEDALKQFKEDYPRVE